MSEQTIRRAVRVTTLPEGQVLLLLGRAGAAAPVIPGADMRPAGPGQWFVVGEADPAALSALADVAISDQGHGRMRVLVEGAPAAAMLAKGTAVDLDALPVGQSATTLIGPIGAHLTRTGADSFELLVLRGFAQALLGDLEIMAREY